MQKVADRMASSECRPRPDCFFRQSLIWFYTVCPDLSVGLLRIIKTLTIIGVLICLHFSLVPLLCCDLWLWHFLTVSIDFLPCGQTADDNKTNNCLANYYFSHCMTKPTNDCAPSEDSDQPGHPPSLIRVFIVHSMGS